MSMGKNVGIGRTCPQERGDARQRSTNKKGAKVLPEVNLTKFLNGKVPPSSNHEAEGKTGLPQRLVPCSKIENRVWNTRAYLPPTSPSGCGRDIRKGLEGYLQSLPSRVEECWFFCPSTEFFSFPFYFDNQWGFWGPQRVLEVPGAYLEGTRSVLKGTRSLFGG